MSNYHLNTLSGKAQPREAALGRIKDDVELDSVVSALEAIGIEGDRLYLLQGAAGVEQLEHRGTWMSRLLDGGATEPIAALNEGATLIGVFGVEGDRADSVRTCLHDSGVVNIHYFGKWTYE